MAALQVQSAENVALREPRAVRVHHCVHHCRYRRPITSANAHLRTSRCKGPARDRFAITSQLPHPDGRLLPALSPTVPTDLPVPSTTRLASVMIGDPTERNVVTPGALVPGRADRTTVAAVAR
jgi:hypothetical protein